MQARVLIIEDVKEMAELVRLYLQKEGMDAAICETGEEALAQFARERFDLVVLDINLPGMDGFEFLQRLRKTSAVPVMIVSARDADEDMILGPGHRGGRVRHQAVLPEGARGARAGHAAPRPRT